jgi:hypothetical protein
MPSPRSRSQISYDNVVEQGLQRALLHLHLDAITRATADERLEPRHLRALAEVIAGEGDNAKIPTIPAMDEHELGAALFELEDWGYVISSRLAGRYVTAMPPIDDLKREIAELLTIAAGGR